MSTLITLSGQLPEHWQEALKELENDLGFTVGAGGLSVFCTKGQELAVSCDGETVAITWAQPVQLYRALSLIPQPLAVCDIHEKPCFENVGPMFDCSRNAVLSPETLRMFLRKMAIMGLNLGMMYTEDTYEVPEQPFIGYKRGRYTYDEIKALDDYPDSGVEQENIRHLHGWQAAVRVSQDGKQAMAVLHTFADSPARVEFDLPDGNWAIDRVLNNDLTVSTNGRLCFENLSDYCGNVILMHRKEG